MISEIGDFGSYKKNLIEVIENKNLRQTIGHNAKKTGREYFDYFKGSRVYLT